MANFRSPDCSLVARWVRLSWLLCRSRQLQLHPASGADTFGTAGGLCCCGLRQESQCCSVSAALLDVETRWVLTSLVKQHLMLHPSFGAWGFVHASLSSKCLVSSCELYVSHCLVFFIKWWSWPVRCSSSNSSLMVTAACLIITQPACLAALGLVLIIVVMSPSCLVADGACRSQLLQLTVTSTNLVDPASSHMLVSKIKPCMSQYKLLYGETANGSLKQL